MEHNGILENLVKSFELIGAGLENSENKKEIEEEIKKVNESFSEMKDLNEELIKLQNSL